jgi:hypothetical protein
MLLVFIERLLKIVQTNFTKLYIKREKVYIKLESTSKCLFVTTKLKSTSYFNKIPIFFEIPHTNF